MKCKSYQVLKLALGLHFLEVLEGERMKLFQSLSFALVLFVVLVKPAYSRDIAALAAPIVTSLFTGQGSDGMDPVDADDDDKGIITKLRMMPKEKLPKFGHFEIDIRTGDTMYVVKVTESRTLKIKAADLNPQAVDVFKDGTCSVDNATSSQRVN